MTTSLLLALAAGFLSGLWFSPLVVIPIALASALAALYFNLTISGSARLAIVFVVAAVNVGYLLGALAVWRRGNTNSLKSMFSTRRFMR